MIQKWTKSICALALALLFTPLISAEAHDRSRRHQHRRNGTIVFINNRNPTPAVPRRVRRGRNPTPGVRRGPFRTTTTTTIITPRRNRVGAAAALGRGHKRGHGRH